MEVQPSNLSYSLASDFILHTSRSVFLTGKAGTGKTTLLRHVRENTHKKAVVLAPTGVAAINAGGSTIHSFFNIPPYGPFIPVNRNELPSGNIIDRRRLFQNIRMGEEKREMINDLEMIVIDEISMVRCDLLDVVDVILRTFRRRHNEPFGGVQMVFIGDLFQLPPVVRDDDWPILSEFYASPFFFDAKALAEEAPLCLELTHVYRQRDESFIRVLNGIRENSFTDEDMQLLEQRFDPGFVTADDNSYITLTTHNYKADAINQAELRRLSSPAETFQGKIEGEFPDNALPAEMQLNLKPGAQVMFIRNDNDEDPRYFNGKIAVVSRIEKGEVYVNFRGSEVEMKVPRVEWKNVRYSYDREKEAIIEEALGTYQQLPLRLAWAITIHKSQGLTFEKAVLDLGDSFAPGQVYVALSRCVSLSGLILKSRIRPDSMRVDPRIQNFTSRQNDPEILQLLLTREMKGHQTRVLVRAFDFQKLPSVVDRFQEFLPGSKITDYKSAVDLGEALKERAAAIVDVSNKFQLQVSRLIEAGTEQDPSVLTERVRKAIAYFVKELWEGMLEPINSQIERRGPKTKKYTLELRALKAAVVKRLERLRSIRLGDVNPSEGISFPDLEKENHELAKPVKAEKQPKGASQRETLEMHQKGMPVEKIAIVRNLAVSTIITHLAQFVATGVVRLEDVVPRHKSEAIEAALRNLSGEPMVRVRNSLGNDYSIAEIMAVVGHQAWSKDTVGRSHES
jgi:hypothetical protein